MRASILMMSLIVAACTAPLKNPAGIEAMDRREYISLVRKNTSGTDQYQGFHQTFQADVTMMTTELQTEALRQRAMFLQWDQRTYQQEREKMLQEATAYAKFFLRFYTPDRHYDDLHKGKTIWKVYLDYNGNRFEGKVRKLTEKMIELQTIYPNMNRFSSPYEVTFNVPMSTIEQGPSKFVMTSSLGQAEFPFPLGK